MTDAEMLDALIEFLKSLVSEALNWPDKTVPHEDTPRWIAIRDTVWQSLEDLRGVVAEVSSVSRYIGMPLSDHIANILVHAEAIVMMELTAMITAVGVDYEPNLAELREKAREKFSAVHRALDEIVRVYHESREK